MVFLLCASHKYVIVEKTSVTSKKPNNTKGKILSHNKDVIRG